MEVYLSHMAMNNDNEEIPTRLKRQVMKPSQVVLYETKPIKYMTTDSFWSRWPDYHTKLFFENTYQETYEPHKPDGRSAFSVKIINTD